MKTENGEAAAANSGAITTNDDPRQTPTPAADPSRCIRGRGSRLENETVIVFNETEEPAIVTTASRVEFRKLVRLGHAQDPGFAVNEANTAARFLIPKKKICFRSAKPRARRRPTMPFLSQKPRSEGHSGEERTPDGPSPLPILVSGKPEGS
jgi:hypothetical protein